MGTGLGVKGTKAGDTGVKDTRTDAVDVNTSVLRTDRGILGMRIVSLVTRQVLWELGQVF